MKSIRITAIALLFILPVAVFAIEISGSDSARLDVVSRTSFGIDLDNPYRYGLANELTQFDLVFGLAPYQRVSNKLNSPDAVGFIELTLFNLDLVKAIKGVGYNPPSGMGNNRYQTGEFIAGIAKGPWVFQMNAGGNEPFGSPWNKGMQYINDGFKFSWAYLDSMVDIRRVNTITGVPIITKRGEENMGGAGQTMPHETMHQFGLDVIPHIGDRLGADYRAEMVAAMYNSDNFGLALKLGTQFPFHSDAITPNNPNGLAVGFDTVFTSSEDEGLKVFFSLMNISNWSPSPLGPDAIIGGTRIGYNIPLSDDISVEPWVGADTRIDFADGEMSKPGYELSFGASMRWPGQGGWFKDYIVNSDGRVFPGMSLGYKLFDTPGADGEYIGMEHSIKFTLFEPAGDEGLFYVLGSEIVIDIIDLTGVTKDAVDNNDYPGGLAILATAYFDLELNRIGKIPGMLRPWTILYFDNIRKEVRSDERISDFKIDLGLNLENAIQNTTFGLVWNSGSLIQDGAAGFMRAFVEIRM